MICRNYVKRKLKKGILSGNYISPILKRNQLFNLKFSVEILNNISQQDSTPERYKRNLMPLTTWVRGAYSKFKHRGFSYGPSARSAQAINEREKTRICNFTVRTEKTMVRKTFIISIRFIMRAGKENSWPFKFSGPYSRIRPRKIGQSERAY